MPESILTPAVEADAPETHSSGDASETGIPEAVPNFPLSPFAS